MRDDEFFREDVYDIDLEPLGPSPAKRRRRKLPKTVDESIKLGHEFFKQQVEQSRATTNIEQHVKLCSYIAKTIMLQSILSVVILISML